MPNFSPSGFRVLIVEDNEHLAHSIQRALTGAGMECHWAGDSVGGLSEFKTSAPHLVLLSLHATGRHGYDLCRVLHELSSVPVILICPNDAREPQIQGFRCGADDCVVKPIDPSLVTSRVLAHLRRTYVYNSASQNKQAAHHRPH